METPPTTPLHLGLRVLVAAGLVALAAAVPLPPVLAGLLGFAIVLWLSQGVLTLPRVLRTRSRWTTTWLGPLSVALLSGVALTSGLANGNGSGAGLPLVVAAVVQVARNPRIRISTICLVTAFGTIGLITGALVWRSFDDLLITLLALALVVLVTLLRRNSRRTAQQEKQMLTQQLDNERERAEKAALVERARLAEDLHDVLAHSLGALTAQLNAAEALAQTGRWDQAREKITSSRRLAADGLTEARQAVAALRSEGTLDADLKELTRVHREAGGTVELEVNGTGRPLPPDTREAARRVVQELLTNARKHAPGKPVDLEVAWSPTTVTIAATNPMATSAQAYAGGNGAGLVGMQRRVQALGGRMSRTHTPDDEFSVTCSLPVEAR